MREESLKLRADDGVELALRRWAPDGGDLRGAVQIVHGMAEHIARYAPVAEALTARGLVVYGHDQRGHGETAPNDAALGHFADEGGIDLALADIRRVRREIREREGELPLCLLGHSMGSFLSIGDATAHPAEIDALALSGSNQLGGALVRAGRLVARVERRRLGKRRKSALLTKLSFGSFNRAFEPARTEMDWLSRDTREVDAYLADPHCGFDCTTELWVGLLGLLQELGRPERLARLPSRLPVYVLGGQRDPVSGGDGSGLRGLLDQLHQAGVRPIEHRIYPGGRHEMFNEVNRDEVLADLGNWIERALVRS